MFRRTLIAVPTLALAGRGIAQSGAAIRFVVPNSPGTGTDQVARILAPHFQARLGAASVVVDNRSGASGVIGADIVAKSRPDGTTILLAAASHAINASMVPQLPYDVLRDFTPVSLVAMLPTLLVVSPSFPARDFQEFVAFARAHPGRVTHGSVGAASTQSLAGGLMRVRLGIELTNVPYREAGPLMAELMSGRIDASFNNITTTIGAVQAGRVRPLAVALSQRWPSLPDVPTFSELGMPELQASSWIGMFAPAGTPPALVEQYGVALRASLAVSEVRAKILENGGLPEGSSSEEMKRFFESEVESWGAVVRATGARLE